MKAAAWVPFAVPREGIKGSCSRRCCWRGPHGSCATGGSCRCHSAAHLAEVAQAAEVRKALEAIITASESAIANEEENAHAS